MLYDAAVFKHLLENFIVFRAKQLYLYSFIILPEIILPTQVSFFALSVCRLSLMSDTTDSLKSKVFIRFGGNDDVDMPAAINSFVIFDFGEKCKSKLPDSDGTDTCMDNFDLSG